MYKLKIISLITMFVVSIMSIAGQDAAQEVITLERTACFGTCPIYTVSILDDGTIIYNGENFVEVAGEQTSTIDSETVDLMIEAFINAGYLDWDEAYTTRTVSDLPSVITSLTINGETHRIERYAGDSSAPILLPYLEQWIDVMVNTSLWTGAQSEIANIATMNSPIITLERSACFGFCPIYKVALFEDGTGVYMGIANVDNIGVHEIEVEPFMVDLIVDQANIFGYFDWQDSYEDRLMTDQPTVITTIQTVEHYKRIARYMGDPNAPVGLIWIEDRIDQALLPVAD